MTRGSLVVAGTGIMSVGQITLETQGWIEQADVVVYCVADPATEVWVRSHSRASRDLYTQYGNDKRRIDTYHSMVEMMVSPVREGKTVCALFYGHPGVFVHPGHKAIEILRAEGYPARMLPAVSALDCLFSDVGIDPSVVGCFTYEATDLLLRRRPLEVESHGVIWQIGCVGDFGFNFSGYNNRYLDVLVDYLEEAYEPEHEVVHYQGAQYPVCPPVVERLALRDLRTAKVSGISTLYLPPVAVRPIDGELAAKLDLHLAAGSNGGQRLVRRPPPQPDGVPVAKPAGRYPYYMPTYEDSRLADYIARLAVDPRLLDEHLKDPERAARLHGGLDDDERRALVSGHSGRIRLAMKDRAPVASILHAVHDAEPDNAGAELLRTATVAPRG
jgi:Tetrapyrrole (Corrin/Porphyrin) Methylases